MSWTVRFGNEFEAEFAALPAEVCDEIAAGALMLTHKGPLLGRPWVDSLKGSEFPNMKELRLSAADGEWRVAFAFDPAQQAILLVAGDKSGGSESRFYRNLIGRADKRYAVHLKTLNRKKR